MARLLMRHSIVVLEKLFSSSNDDFGTLQALEEELKHRNVPRAAALLNKVQRALRSANPPSAAPEPATRAATPPPAQRALWSEEPTSTHRPVATSPSARTRPSAASVSHLAVCPPANASAPPKLASKSVEVAPYMSAAEAYRVLKATPNTPWETIEQTRRLLVQQAHPEKVAGLNPERHAQAQEDAKRANKAYAILIQDRMQDNRG